MLFSDQKHPLVIKLKNGDFDKDIFSNPPNKTADLQQLISLKKGELIEKLLSSKLNSKETLDYWLKEGAQWPKSALGSALALCSPLFVFEKLHECGMISAVVLPPTDGTPYFPMVYYRETEGLEDRLKKLEKYSPKAAVYLRECLYPTDGNTPAKKNRCDLSSS
jgi:hypothetical protein